MIAIISLAPWGEDGERYKKNLMNESVVLCECVVFFLVSRLYPQVAQGSSNLLPISRSLHQVTLGNVCVTVLPPSV